MNTGLREQIAAATDVVQKTELEDRFFFISASRALLGAVFLSLGILVYKARSNMKKEENGGLRP